MLVVPSGHEAVCAYPRQPRNVSRSVSADAVEGCGPEYLPSAAWELTCGSTYRHSLAHQGHRQHQECTLHSLRTYAWVSLFRLLSS
jgi:hypothetical protein